MFFIVSTAKVDTLIYRRYLPLNISIQIFPSMTALKIINDHFIFLKEREIISTFKCLLVS
jgi:hypothetical protein